MKLGQGLKARIKLAIETDNTIIVDRDKLAETMGFTPDYLNYLGLSKADLKKLEKKGYAIRGYQRIRRPGKIYLKGIVTRVNWVLLSPVREAL